MRVYRFFFPLLVLLVFCAVASDSKTVYVTPGGAGSKDGSNWANASQSIASGLTASASGDEIWVKASTYNEAITIDQGVAIYAGFAGDETTRVQRNWTANVTTIDATGLNDHAVYASSSGALDGFTITGGQADFGGGVLYQQSSLSLANCVITGNNANYGGGLYSASSTPTLTNCIITGNSVPAEFGSGGGVFCNYSSPTLTNCTITGNNASEGAGVYSSDGVLTLTNCILRNPGTEITGYSASNAVVSYSSVPGGWPGEGNIDGDQLFVDAEKGNFRLLNGSACLDRGSLSAAPAQDINGNPRPGADGKVDMGAYESPDGYEPGSSQHAPRTLYVRVSDSAGGDGSSWETAFASIGAALLVSGTSDEIHVASGRYAEAILMEPGVAIYGGFTPSDASRSWTENKTIIDAKGLNSPAVVAANNAILDGFTITGGSEYSVGGVSCKYASSPTLTNCVITGSIAGFGGGVYCEWNSSPTLTNCVITGNRANANGGGVYCGWSSSPSLTNCTIAGNTAGFDSGGVFCEWDSSPTLTNCILWNPGEELHVESNSSPVVNYSSVEGEYAGTGNISDDPQFVYPWDGQWADLHLMPDSPCIDSGTTIAFMTVDLDGLSRPYGAGHDMGAYEYRPDYATPTPTDTPIVTPTFTPTDTPTDTPPAVSCDINHDGKIDGLDMLMLFSEFGQNVQVGDLNGDGTVDSEDLFYFASRWRTIP